MRIVLSFILLILVVPLTSSADALPLAGDSNVWLLHLPGIAGKRRVDGYLLRGFQEGGLSGTADIYDWTEENPGIGALLAYKQNQIEAQKVADMITAQVREHPTLHVIVSAHSGGTGIAVWALEKLPADVKIDTLVLLASALSPGYDLSKALSHVRGRCYSFCSENDVLVLSVGTRMFGTIDGKKTDAAGHVGFELPPTADMEEYAKLIQLAYDHTWVRYNNIGDHMGCMLRPFVRQVVAPLVIGGHSAGK